MTEESILNNIELINLAHIEHIENCAKMKISNYGEVYKYNSLDIDVSTVLTASEKVEDIIDVMKKCKSVNKIFNILITGSMGVGKTQMLKKILSYLKENDVKMLYITPINLLGMQQLQDDKMYDENQNLLEQFSLQRHLIAGDRSSVDFNNLNGDMIISNLNNIKKSLGLLSKNKTKAVIAMDEAHMYRLEQSLRDSNLTDEESSQIIAMMEELLKECNQSNNKYGVEGVLWITSTPEVYAYDNNIEFTKIFEINKKKDSRITAELYEPLVISNFSDNNVLLAVSHMLEKNILGLDKQVVYLNDYKQAQRVVEKLKSIKDETGKFQNIDFENGVECISSKNIDRNLTYEYIEKNRKIPEHIQLLFVTSLMTAGVNIENEETIDLILFCNKDRFNFSNEVQMVGRFRNGIRYLYTVSRDSSKKQIMSFKTYLERNKDEIYSYAKAVVDALSNRKSLKTSQDKLRELKIYKNNNTGNVYNAIVVVNNEFKISDNALMGILFTMYQREEVLSSVKGLATKFYHHNALNIKNVAEEKIIESENCISEIDITKMLGEIKLELKDNNKEKDTSKKEIEAKVKEIKSENSKVIIDLISGKVLLSNVDSDIKNKYMFLVKYDSKRLDIIKDYIDDKKMVDLYINHSTITELTKCIQHKRNVKMMKELKKQKHDSKEFYNLLNGMYTSNKNIKLIYYMDYSIRSILEIRNKKPNGYKLNNDDYSFIYDVLVANNIISSKFTEYNLGGNEKNSLKSKKKFSELPKDIDNKNLDVLTQKKIIQEIQRYVKMVSNVKKDDTRKNILTLSSLLFK